MLLLEQLTLYAGGGLLASSELNDEWLETEKKLQTMRRIIVPSSLHDPQPVSYTHLEVYKRQA